MLIMLALSLYLGFVSPNVSNIAHLSGLAAGFAVCILIYRNPERRTDSNG
jgi:membrane associated rhomboid family serine protease